VLNQTLQTEIKKSDLLSQKLNESRGQLQSLLSNLIGAAYRCNFDEYYTMQYISEKIRDISGYPSSDFIHNRVRTYSSVIHPDDVDFCEKISQKQRKTRRLSKWNTGLSMLTEILHG
jgi:hypothetical protein